MGREDIFLSACVSWPVPTCGFPPRHTLRLRGAGGAGGEVGGVIIAEVVIKEQE